MGLEIATIGERGQIVIPQSLRDDLHIDKGDKFMIIKKGDIIIFKKLREPTKQEFAQMLKKAHESAEKHSLTEKDLENALNKVMSRK
ncbi:AbrB/MazE/SpoVT family DNA-binding domain-containing protein [Candidatus Woesearchaeota archaeon]|nr:AbrB/MazE/SpoVT family DNA-binding domain-containing protein [Candidatus Woesearchaeota archaeon]